MRTRNFCRAWWGLSLVLALAGCGSSESAADNPYAHLKDPPLVQAKLYAVNLVSDTDAIAVEVVNSGRTEAKLAPNYQQADAVEASIWGVAEPVASQVRHFKAPPGGTDIRLLQMPLAAKGRSSEPAVDKAFFRNVLGTDIPVWPLKTAQPANVRILVWTYQVPDILAAAKRLRESGIPVIYNPVSITTSYLGTYKTLAIRAPDGTVVQLIEVTAL